ncbi:hypothetical protein VNO77_14761 [Canavalia gladiata]|uniref:Uncharacterized protein n=1 Tax=Canavalia gladiata TaxID=3824 RepID=A0AAN9QS39_CANGL
MSQRLTTTYDKNSHQGVRILESGSDARRTGRPAKSDVFVYLEIPQRSSSVHLRSQLLHYERMVDNSLTLQGSRTSTQPLRHYVFILGQNVRETPGTATTKDWRVLSKKILPEDPPE